MNIYCAILSIGLWYRCRVRERNKEDRMYLINHASGASNCAEAATLLGAKREASGQMTFGGKSVSVVNTKTKEIWRREFWQELNRFGWEKWTKVQ